MPQTLGEPDIPKISRFSNPPIWVYSTELGGHCVAYVVGTRKVWHRAKLSYPLRLGSSQVSSPKLAGAPHQNAVGTLLRSRDLSLSQF